MEKIAFAKLVSFVTDTAQRTLTPPEIFDLNSLTQGLALNTEVTRTLVHALATDRKIEAIKAYRTLTGDGLKESKDAVETVTDRFRDGWVS